MRLCVSFAQHMHRSTFSMAAVARFNMPARDTGILLSYMGVVGFLMQFFAVKALCRRYSEDSLILASAVLMLLSFMLYTVATTRWLWGISLAPLAIASAVMRTLIISALTKAAPADSNQAVLGLSVTMDSICRILSPFIGGIIIQQAGAQWVGIGSSGACCLLIVAASTGRAPKT